MATALQEADVHLDRIIDRCRALEERAGALYRAFAAADRSRPELCALWTALARQEGEHARSLAAVRQRVRGARAAGTTLDGWADALGTVDERLAVAERLDPAAPIEAKLAAALALETTELDAARHAILGATDDPPEAESSDHAERLADAAERLTDDPQVRLQAAVLRARAYLSRPETASRA